MLYCTRFTAAVHGVNLSLSIKVNVCHDSRGVPTHSEWVSDEIQNIDKANCGNWEQKDFCLR